MPQKDFPSNLQFENLRQALRVQNGEVVQGWVGGANEINQHPHQTLQSIQKNVFQSNRNTQGLQNNLDTYLKDI